MPFPAIDLSLVKTYPLAQRKNLVSEQNFISPGSIKSDVEFEELPALVETILEARLNESPVIWMIGGHVIKSGLSPIIIELMKNGIITHLASNGAASIHDFEIAFLGHTSEDVAVSLENGSFGMAEETGAMMNQAIRQGARDGLGMGEALGKLIAESDAFPHKEKSLLSAAYSMKIPYSVHVAIGTDIIHQHPTADFASIGWATGQDFKIFTHSVSKMEGGVFCNFGSAVIGPEIFLKAVSIARNLGHPLRKITTANFDLYPLTGNYHVPSGKDNPEYYYRPKKNIVIRPTSLAGKGYHITGDHRDTIPAIYQLIQQQNKLPNNQILVDKNAITEDAAELSSVFEPFTTADSPLQHMVEQNPNLITTARSIIQAFRALELCFSNNGTLFICGNGGSFADAIHIAGELNKSFKRSRKIPSSHHHQFDKYQGGNSIADHLQSGLRTIVLGCNPALASAVDNDLGKEAMVFAQELYVLSRPGDVLLGISTSGKSQNILNAGITAKSRGLTFIGLTGKQNSPLKNLADITIQAQSESTTEIQSQHLTIYHTLCDMLEEYFFNGDA